MDKFVKIYGAGSIGNHLTNASICLGYNVIVVDVDDLALERMKNDIYPNRYGVWNDKISLFQVGTEPEHEYELICIGTPPSTHIDILLSVLKYHAGPILVEKPLCEPRKETILKLKNLTIDEMNRIYVGYNHVISKASNTVEEIIKSDLGEILSLDVEFRENWRGIFAAHPWLSGPKESYLGDINQGGGSSGEHSHALNLWQHFGRKSNLGEIKSVFSKYNLIKKDKLYYDEKSYFLLETDTGFTGSVTQDVITSPSRKSIKIQGKNLFVEWICNNEGNKDLVRTVNCQNITKKYIIDKSRPDDFIIELEHILNRKDNTALSPINLKYGIKTMEVLISALESNLSNKQVNIF